MVGSPIFGREPSMKSTSPDGVIRQTAIGLVYGPIQRVNDSLGLRGFGEASSK